MRSREGLSLALAFSLVIGGVCLGSARSEAASSMFWDMTVSLGTPTATPTPGATPSGTPVLEHFRLTGNPHPGWFNVYNVYLTGDGTGKADLTYQPGDSATWGYATSNTFANHDIDGYPHMRVVITNVDASTGNEIWVNDGASSRVRIGSGLGVGIHDFDVRGLTGWSGTKSFYLEAVVQSTTTGTGTRFDEIQLYHSASNGMVEHFWQSGNPYPGWYNVYNANLAGDGTGKADLTYQPGDSAPWGYVTSNTFSNFDIDTFGFMRIVITRVDASTGNEIWVNDGAGSRVQVGSGLGVGVHNVDVNTLTGWNSPKSFYIELVVQSTTPGTGTRFDEIKLGTREY